MKFILPACLLFSFGVYAQQRPDWQNLPAATQVNEIILQSVVISPYLEKYCKTSRAVNAFNALSLAAQYQ